MRGCRPLSDSEISRLLDLLDLLSSPACRRERAFIVLGLRTGLLLTSMLSLRIGDVAIAGEVQNRIRIRRGTTKGRLAGYDMPLHPQAATALQDYLDTLLDQSRDAYLFPGRRPSTRLSKRAGWRAIKRAFAAAGILGAPTEVGTHSLRKTFAQRIVSVTRTASVR